MISPIVRRPVGVSLLSILLIIAGIFDIVAGIVVLATRNDANVRLALRDVTSGSLTTLAIVTIAMGVLVLLVALSLRRGANWARAVVAGVAIARLIILIWSVIAHHSYHWYQALLPAAIYALVAGYLFYDEEARRFFESSYVR
jgi:hypothetical protein